MSVLGVRLPAHKLQVSRLLTGVIAIDRRWARPSASRRSKVLEIFEVNA